jgi:lantibiotic modifying enzyme
LLNFTASLARTANSASYSADAGTALRRVRAAVNNRSYSAANHGAANGTTGNFLTPINFRCILFALGLIRCILRHIHAFAVDDRCIHKWI